VREGGSAGAVLNAADEAAVEAFLGRRIAFGDIAEIVARTLDAPRGAGNTVRELLDADAAARSHASLLAARLAPDKP
jgi:1-deoxy-D-xylulose-5-phosphate reductoisomerase